MENTVILPVIVTATTTTAGDLLNALVAIRKVIWLENAPKEIAKQIWNAISAIKLAILLGNAQV